MGQAPGSQKDAELSWDLGANCACVQQTGNVVESIGDIKKQTDTFALDSEIDDAYEGAGLSALALNRSELVLARRRVFSPHLRTTFSEHYRVIRRVGEGTYGNVFEAEPREPTQEPSQKDPEITGICTEGGATSSRQSRRVAVKCFKLSQISAEDPTGMGVKTLKESFEKERAILARSEHPHIVKIYECFEERDSLWIVLELCRGGELYEYVATRAQQRRAAGGAFDEPEARLYFRQMLHAVGFLHANRIVHRDIKTENFLLLGNPKTEEGGIIKLCDFGTAMQLTHHMPRAQGRIGTLSYTAPEIYARRGADLCADLWSLGVVLYVLLVGASPFRITGAEPRSETSKRILAGNYDTTRPGWQKLTEGAQNLVSKLLVVEEKERHRIPDAVQHPWMERSSALITLKEKQVVEQQKVLTPISEKEVDLADYAHHIQKVLYLVSCFAGLDPMQQLLISVYAQVTPDSELADLDLPLPWYELFFALDEDEDGRLGFSELARGLQKLVTIGLGEFDPRHEDKVNVLVRALDLDGNGYVDWVEWTALALSSSSSLATQPEPLRTIFRMIDRPSGDRAITAVDLLALLNSDSAGQSLTTAKAQEQAQMLLTKWAPERPSQSPRGGASAAPYLTMEDLQTVLQAAAKQCSPYTDNQQLPWHTPSEGGVNVNVSKQLSWLRCCEMARMDDRPEMVAPLPAIPPVNKGGKRE
eukprot:TRINITY_DN29717_c0_g1_i1.p1 TRINITY_DN29717_c0_g1~~TRINITY_DN29717_c0_g1_i1.p1  ORF type:complete len:703 (-),score=117.01 TRINITY_DN29717_c0_g1_i1:270-2378(-)